MRRAIAVLLAGLLLLSAIPTVTASEPVTGEQAQLNIQQPHYIDSDVTVNTSGSVPIYEVNGPRQYITPANFNQSDVIEYGATTPGASLTRNQDLDIYQLEVESAGTYEVYWTVLERRKVTETSNNTTTTTVKQVEVTYRAQIRVGQVNYQHLPQGKLDQMREDAANWSAFSQAVLSQRVAGPDANMEEQVQLAINLLRLRHQPWSALTGNFTQILILLATTLGGFILLVFILMWVYFQRRSDITFRRKVENLDVERAELEEQLDEVQLHERMLTLEGMDWNDLFDDATARAFREAFGETVLDAWLRINQTLSPRAVVTDRVAAMSEDYVVTADGEQPGEDGEPGSLKLHEWSAAPEDEHVYTFGPDEDADLDIETVVDGVAWDDPELKAFDLASGAETDAVTIEGADLDELIEEYDIAIEHDFDGDRELLAEYLHEFLQAVEEHRITDADGRPKSMRVAMNTFLRAARLLRDRHETPLASFQADHVERLLEMEDEERDIQQYVTDVQEGRLNAD